MMTEDMTRNELLDTIEDYMLDLHLYGQEDRYESLFYNVLKLEPGWSIKDCELSDDALRDFIYKYIQDEEDVPGGVVVDQSTIEHIAYSSKEFEFVTDTILEIRDYRNPSTKIVMDISKLTPEILEELRPTY